MSIIQRPRRQHRGFSLIEIMVGIVIGLIAVLVIYQIFAAAEGIRRNTTSVGDAQQNGLLSSFMLTIELANASHGIANAMTDLGNCPNTGNMATTFRPIPVLVTQGASDTDPDSFVVNYSLATAMIAPVQFYVPASAGQPFKVLSPLGFKAGDLMVGISSSGNCVVSKATAVTGPDGVGVITITHTPVATDFSPDDSLLNLGQSNNPQRVRYDVNAGTLRSTLLWDANGQADAGPVAKPIASNIVNLKLLYGIDTVGDNLLHAWVKPTGAWSDANLMAAPITTLTKIKAIRIGIVVRGEQWDKSLGPQSWTLFSDDATNVMTGTIPAAGGNYRLRPYETIVPLRNPIWNPAS